MELPLSEFANRNSTILISQMSRFDNFLLQTLVKINSLELYVTQILNYSKNHQLCMALSPPWLKPRWIIPNPIQTDSRYPVTLCCYYNRFSTDIKCHNKILLNVKIYKSKCHNQHLYNIYTFSTYRCIQGNAFSSELGLLNC